MTWARSSSALTSSTSEMARFLASVLRSRWMSVSTPSRRPGPHPAQPEREPGQVGQRVVVGGPAPVGRRLIPVAAQQLLAGPVRGQAREKPEQPRVIPGNRVSGAGSVHGRRAVGEYVPGVHEQRAAVHATPPFLDARGHQIPSRPPRGFGSQPAGEYSVIKSAHGVSRSVNSTLIGTMRIMRILVLGGARFVGRAVVDQAVSRGHDVTTFSRGRTASRGPGPRRGTGTGPSRRTCSRWPPGTGTRSSTRRCSRRRTWPRAPRYWPATRVITPMYPAWRCTPACPGSR